MHVLLKLWLHIEVLAVTCKILNNLLTSTFSFPRSGAVKHCVIKTSINQVSKANITFQAAKRLENMTG